MLRYGSSSLDPPGWPGLLVLRLRRLLAFGLPIPGLFDLGVIDLGLLAVRRALAVLDGLHHDQAGRLRGERRVRLDRLGHPFPEVRMDAAQVVAHLLAPFAQ